MLESSPPTPRQSSVGLHRLLLNSRGELVASLFSNHVLDRFHLSVHHLQSGTLAVELEHIIIRSRDKVTSSRFLAEVLGLAAPRPVSHFMALEVSNGVTLDYDDDLGEFSSQHCAFVVPDDEFEPILERSSTLLCTSGLIATGTTYFADPTHRFPGVVYMREHGRGVYFADPDGHTWRSSRGCRCHRGSHPGVG